MRLRDGGGELVQMSVLAEVYALQEKVSKSVVHLNARRLWIGRQVGYLYGG